MSSTVKSNAIRSTTRELKDRVFFIMGVIPVTKCSPTIKLHVLVQLDRLNQSLTRIPRGRESVFAAILIRMEEALKAPNPSMGLLEAQTSLTVALDYLDQHPAGDF